MHSLPLLHALPGPACLMQCRSRPVNLILEGIWGI